MSTLSSAANRIKVLLAEDHQMVREGIKSLLQDERDLEVVGEAETGREAVRLAGELLPDVIVMDVSMPSLNGLEAARQILTNTPALPIRILMLSDHEDTAHVSYLLAMGVSGYLLKQNSFKVLSDAIRQVYRGNIYLSPSLLKGAGEYASEGDGAFDLAGNGFADLSSREVEVLQLIAEGKSNKQIAPELNISVKTVEKHRQNLMDKLNIHDIAGLTRYAISTGVIENKVLFAMV
jgi:DNA-binding NarL/FixJ family response regulator